MSNAAFAVNCNNDIEMSRHVPRMVPIKEASQLTGLSERFLRNAYLNGHIVGIRLGGNNKNGKVLLNFDRLIDYLNEHTEQVSSEPVCGHGAMHPFEL